MKMLIIGNSGSLEFDSGLDNDDELGVWMDDNREDITKEEAVKLIKHLQEVFEL